MNSNDESSISGSSTSSTWQVVTGKSKKSVASGSSALHFLNFEKPLKNISGSSISSRSTRIEWAVVGRSTDSVGSGSSISGSSTSSEWPVVGKSRLSVTSGSSTFDYANFKKPPRNIIITEESTNDQKLAKEKRRQQIIVNEREQQRLDLDVILSGFPSKPAGKTVVEKFVSIHKIPITKVRTFYQFENKTLGGTFYHIVITFQDKPAKSQLLKTHAGLSRGIRWAELTQNMRHDDFNAIIKCHSRFSKFNFGVEKQLRRLSRSSIIADYKFNGMFYSFKQTPVSAWKTVSVIEDLDHLMDLLNYVIVR